MPPITSDPPEGDCPTVFICYSHQDRRWQEDLCTMLAPLMQTGTVQFWWDGKIPAGEPWREEIDRAMASAQVAVLLVSAPFLASKFITEVEMPRFVEAARQRQVQLLWVPVSPCLHENTPLAHIQAAHDPARPLSTLTKPEREVALKKICQEIEKAARRRSGLPVAKPPLPASPRIEPTVSTSHLPVTSSLFVGREAERAELDAGAFASSRGMTRRPGGTWRWPGSSWMRRGMGGGSGK